MGQTGPGEGALRMTSLRAKVAKRVGGGVILSWETFPVLPC